MHDASRGIAHLVATSCFLSSTHIKSEMKSKWCVYLRTASACRGSHSFASAVTSARSPHAERKAGATHLHDAVVVPRGEEVRREALQAVDRHACGPLPRSATRATERRGHQRREGEGEWEKKGHSLMRARAGLDDLAGAHVDDAASTISPDRAGVETSRRRTGSPSPSRPPTPARRPRRGRACGRTAWTGARRTSPRGCPARRTRTPSRRP